MIHVSTSFSKMMRDFFAHRYGRLFHRSQMEDGRIVTVGDTLRLSSDDIAAPRQVVCFFYDDHDEICFGFTEPEKYNPLAPMWEQEARLKGYTP